MKIGTKVKTLWGNLGEIIEVPHRSKYVKVLLDKNKSVASSLGETSESEKAGCFFRAELSEVSDA